MVGKGILCNIVGNNSGVGRLIIIARNMVRNNVGLGRQDVIAPTLHRNMVYNSSSSLFLLITLRVNASRLCATRLSPPDTAGPSRNNRRTGQEFTSSHTLCYANAKMFLHFVTTARRKFTNCMQSSLHSFSAPQIIVFCQCFAISCEIYHFTLSSCL